MKHQQQAEKEEQQRIKNLVLNYDLRESSEDQDGELNFATPKSSSFIYTLSPSGTDRPTSFSLNRLNNTSGKSSGQRTRKLKLSDVADWYDTPSKATFEHRNFNQRTHWNKRPSGRDRTPQVEEQGFAIAERRQGTST